MKTVRAVGEDAEDSLLLRIQRGAAPLENGLAVPPKGKHRVMSKDFAPRYAPKRFKTCPPQIVYVNVYCSVIHNSQEAGGGGRPQMSIN